MGNFTDGVINGYVKLKTQEGLRYFGNFLNN